MNSNRPSRQHGKPLLISALEGPAQSQILNRVHFSEGTSSDNGKCDEWWLQRLLYLFPQSLPIQELEPGIGVLVPIGMEMETPAGYVDNVFVTTEGYIVLAECKLWRNPEARRQVVAQVIDYAQSISRWSYQDFDSALKKSIDAEKRPIGKGLFEILKDRKGDELDIDEAKFVDAISRNLHLGRILLLVVGDGIREGAESLIDYLQMHAGFHFTLGIVEAAVFEVPRHGFIVQPRLMVRTLNIERAIVRLASEGIAVEPGVARHAVEKSSRSTTMSEDIFFEGLNSKVPSTVKPLREFLDKVKDLGVFQDPATKSAGLKWQAPSGPAFNLGGITLDGKLTTYSVGWVPDSIGQIDLAHWYLEQLATIIGGHVKKTPNKTQWCIIKDGPLPDAIDALQEDDRWMALIADYTEKLAKASQS